MFVIYALVCTNCSEFYIGSTKKFRFRMNNHKSANRNPDSTTSLGCNIHFASCSGGDFKCYPFHHITSQDEDLLLSTEEKYIRTFKPLLNNM